MTDRCRQKTLVQKLFLFIFYGIILYPIHLIHLGFNIHCCEWKKSREMYSNSLFDAWFSEKKITEISVCVTQPE